MENIQILGTDLKPEVGLMGSLSKSNSTPIQEEEDSSLENKDTLSVVPVCCLER